MSITSYLGKVAEKWAAIKASPAAFTIVSGNESADIDSCVSSALYAYLSQSQSKVDVFPLINIPKQDILLRRDFLWLLAKLDIKDNSFLFLDDLNPELLKHASLALVDHNKVTASLAQLDDKVIGVIDHHDDEGLYKSADPRVVIKNGSCSSLVYTWWNKTLNGLNGAIASDAALNELALAPLLIDTSNLKSKVEAHDTEAYDLITKALSPVSTFSTSKDIKGFYKTLDQKKRDLSGFDAVQMLRKDYKDWAENGAKLGMSTVVLDLDNILKQDPKFFSKLHDFCEEHNVTVHVTMTSYTDAETGKHGRQMIIYSPGGPSEGIQKFLDAAADLELEPISVDDGHLPGKLWVFLQKNAKASRKQVAPKLRSALFGTHFSSI
ncbi:putative exopolyphosphatase [Yarrowia sp. C11]|nr:putative exopolyphosphatase [Yarrowia sp. E02]KAG5369207.1 putative exopolyphosphatase [Yarrowia sp. C11]